MDHVTRATELFKSGHACSQAVLLAWAPDFGLDADVAARLSAGFAAGMHLGETCGAVTGAIMVIGLATCGSDCVKREGRAPAAKAVDEFAARFAGRVGSLACPEIIGCDLRLPEASAAARDRGLFAERCAPAVRVAAEILEDMLAAR